MTISKLFYLLVAVAVFFAPALTSAGEAAAVPDHHGQMMEAGTCHAPATDSSSDEQAPAQNCCISLCMAAATLTAPATLKGPALKPERLIPVNAFLHRSYLGEIATPPPRRS